MFFCFVRHSFSSSKPIFRIYLFVVATLFLNALLKISSKGKRLLRLLTVLYLQWSLRIYFFYIFPICYNLRRQRNIRKLWRTFAEWCSQKFFDLTLVNSRFLPSCFYKISFLYAFVWYSMVHVRSITITKHRRLQGSSIHRK